ncbi:hypothetical protein R5R35_002352 [Gryllus longicercus]|uniref:Uncharacterized protein n=1 Tax=Gryllus longicercus TaxID=2509291 RepID=A0AAN9VMG3_9ORTH
MEERSASDNEAPAAHGAEAAQESSGPERRHAPQGSPASVRSAASGGPPATARLLAADEPEASVRSQLQARAKSKALEAAQSLGPSPPAADDDIVVVFAGTPAVVPGPVAGACVFFGKHAPDGPPTATPRTPKHPRLPPAFSRTLSMDPGVYEPRHIAGEQPPPAYSDVVQQQHSAQGGAASAHSVSFKIAQFGLTVLCLILLSDGYRLEVNQNVTAMHFPFIVFSSFTLITGVILLGYIMGMKMRELLMRIFGTMGGLLFLISGIHTANRTYVFWDNWEGMIEEGDTDELGFSVTSIPRRRICFVAQVLLSFVASVVYLSDVVFSYRRTMRMLN